MQETTADVRRDIEETRARVSETLAELDGEIGARKEAVRHRVVEVRSAVTNATRKAQESVADFAREHPWYALATALGIGLIVARSRADEAAVRGVITGAKSAGISAAGAAKSAGASAATAAKGGVEKVKGLVRKDEGESKLVGGTVDAEPGDDGGLFYRLQTGIVEAVGGDELLVSMREEAGRIGR